MGRIDAYPSPAQSGTSGQGLKDFGRVKRTAGDIALGSVVTPTWADVETSLDIVLTAATGDFIEYGISGLLGSGTDTFFDVATIVSSAVVTYFSSGTSTATAGGASGWYGRPSLIFPVTGSLMSPALVSGDISSATVTLRLRYSKGGSSGRTFYATPGDPLIVWAKNLGPAM